MSDQLQHTDKQFFSDAMREVAGIVEEPMTVKRFTGVTLGDHALGVGDVPTFQDIPTKGVVVTLEARDIAFSGGLYQFGDIQVELRTKVQSQNEATDRWGDRLIYKGRTYRIVGAVTEVWYGDIQFWKTVWRQVSAA